MLDIRSLVGKRMIWALWVHGHPNRGGQAYGRSSAKVGQGRVLAEVGQGGTHPERSGEAEPPLPTRVGPDGLVRALVPWTNHVTQPLIPCL